MIGQSDRKAASGLPHEARPHSASACLGSETVQGALEIVGDGGEVDLDGGFGETSPSHSAQAVAALPRSEDLLDPAAHTMDRLVPFVKLAQRFLLVTTPHARGDDPGYPFQGNLGESSACKTLARCFPNPIWNLEAKTVRALLIVKIR